jgi:dolichol-phosphate mannosyltransferase
MKVSVIIPTLNEEGAIGKVLEGIHKTLRQSSLTYEILVIDGNSHDSTREIATGNGARVIVEKRRGKGIAMKTGFRIAEGDYVVMLDGDNTYDPNEIPKMLGPLINNEADVVLGKRIQQKDSMTKMNTFGNRIITHLIKNLYKIPVDDVCTGYWAFSKNVMKSLRNIEAVGFDLEACMLIKSARSGFVVSEVPVNYRQREGKAKLRPLQDGLVIAGATIRLLRDYNPLLFFGSIGSILFISSIILGLNVIVVFNESRYLMTGRTLLTVLLLTMSVQFIFFGLLSDLIMRKICEGR